MNNSIQAYLNLPVPKIWMSSKLQLNFFKTVPSHLKRLTEIESADHEVLWVEIKPKRLPRKINKLICVLYHPPSANNERMKCYLFSSLQKIESNHPNCGIVLAGDLIG